MRRLVALISALTGDGQAIRKFGVDAGFLFSSSRIFSMDVLLDRGARLKLRLGDIRLTIDITLATSALRT